ncbi:MAG: S-layer homology domain-containing protein [Clostridia bacterium]|nr:S-layer homology domain-containing protein [Clostridia bacterium]
MKKTVSFVLIFAIFIGIIPVSYAVDLDATAKFIAETVTAPQVGSIGGEWAVIGLARSGYDMPQEYWDSYYTRVLEYIEKCDGVLHTKKYTEYSRVILALTAIGADPKNAAGYNLLTPLSDFDNTVWQGVNGPVWALIALDSGNYPSDMRQQYVDKIVESQLNDGGWNLTGKGDSDSDITGMALTALANYKSQPKVKNAIDKALSFLSETQLDNGGFMTYGEETLESSAQVLVALSTLGIDINDARFVKNGKTVVDAIMAHRNADGSFSHIKGEKTDLMATEQAFYSLVAWERMKNGKAALFDMDDVAISVKNGKPSMHRDIVKNQLVNPDITFTDIGNHKNKDAIEKLASYGIITGRGDGTFDPDATMSRSEFAAIVVRSLGLTPRYSDAFIDVENGKWYSGYIGTAYNYGIVNGKGEGKFDPFGTITRQEAATMVARAAALCGMDTTADVNILAQFGDYVFIHDWAKNSMAFCYEENILDQSDMNTEPVRNILRCEIAQMLCNMLSKVDLI